MSLPRNSWRLLAMAGLLLSGLHVIAAPLAVEAAAKQQPPRPNILFIVLDDFGYADLGANGNAAVTTPNLDRFAAQGVRFTRNYVNASCTVTRAGILTGQQPELHGFRPDALGISPELTTLPEALQQAGYHTAHIGKWHVGFLVRDAWPTRQGFDTFFGFLAQNVLGGQRDGQWLFGSPRYRDPALQLDENPPVVRWGHLSDILAGYTEQTIAELARLDTPWFLSVWTLAPHAPVDPHERYANRYPDTPAGRYLALVEQLDAAVGRILASLETHNIADDTLVMIVSDNGGTGKHVQSNAPFPGGKTSFLEGGVRTPLLLRWPGRLEAGQVSDVLTFYLDYFPTLAQLAGAAAPADQTGYNIFDLLDGTRTRDRNLYWEAINSNSQVWSVLSPDGRWRLQQPLYGDLRLFDLLTDPHGGIDVAADHPDLVQSLRRDYLQWRLASREVALDAQPLDSSGHAKLTGHSFLRSPGYGRYAFAIAIAPPPEANVEPLPERQTIAYQRDMWHLYLEGETLHVEIKDLHMSTPAPAIEDCTTVILTTDYKPGHINPKRKRSIVQLYIDGDLAAESDTRSFKDPAEGYANALYIGQDDSGKTRYAGRLGEARIFSEHLAPPDVDDSKVENGIVRVERALCTDL